MAGPAIDGDSNCVESASILRKPGRRAPAQHARSVGTGQGRALHDLGSGCQSAGEGTANGSGEVPSPLKPKTLLAQGVLCGLHQNCGRAQFSWAPKWADVELVGSRRFALRCEPFESADLAAMGCSFQQSRNPRFLRWCGGTCGTEAWSGRTQPGSWGFRLLTLAHRAAVGTKAGAASHFMEDLRSLAAFIAADVNQTWLAAAQGRRFHMPGARYGSATTGVYQVGSLVSCPHVWPHGNDYISTGGLPLMSPSRHFPCRVPCPAHTEPPGDHGHPDSRNRGHAVAKVGADLNCAVRENSASEFWLPRAYSNFGHSG